MSPFRSLRDYEIFIYTLSQRFPLIIHSTLIVARRGRRFAELAGDLAFPGGHRLVVSADSKLASTHPHHKHILPNIKHHRVPAPELSFTHPNIPFLIHEIDTTLLQD